MRRYVDYLNLEARLIIIYLTILILCLSLIILDFLF